MFLTQRDLFFLEDLTRVKFLNTKRIYKLYQTEVNCRVRLKQMKNENYISTPVIMSNKEHIYTPTKRTYKMFGKKISKIYPNDKLMHYLACADFYFYMKEQLEEFYLEKQYSFNYNGNKYSFRPDMIITSNNKILLIEIDLSNRRFEDKIETWEAFYNSNAFRDYFEKFPPIIIISTNVNKIRGIIKKNKKIDLNYVFKDYKEVREWKYHY